VTNHRSHGRRERTGDPGEGLREMRAPWLWTNWTVVTLGVWLATSPSTFGYGGTAIGRSDVVSGVLLAALASLAIWPRGDFYGRWGVALVGLWLQFAPLVFWAESPAAYLNDTLVGALAITFSVLVPMMPGMAHHRVMEAKGPEVPPGWSYNPSSWSQRAPLIATGALGWFISRYLAAYQLGYTTQVWEPFFGPGSKSVLESEVSRMWPISDAGLGALAYTIETLMGWMGGTSRWRTMPWMVTFFGILVIPLGITHIVLVILQPVVVGHWCTLCLAAAAVMLVMIPLAVDEVVAMIQFLRRSVREGKPFWRTFWVGGTLDVRAEDERSPEYGERVGRFPPAMFWGVTAPWTLTASAAIGLWLMFSPAVLGSHGGAADVDHVAGALVLTFSVIAMAEVVRPVRFVNVFLGAWVLLSPWIAQGASTSARWLDALAGLAVVALALPRGSLSDRYG
jgi:uncharacterized membrane protein